MAQPNWITSAGNLGTIPEGVFYSTPLLAIDPVITITASSVQPTVGITTVLFPTQTNIPFPLETTVELAGFTPSSYNGTYEVVRTSNSSIGIIVPSASTVTVPGTITSVPTAITYEVVAGQLPAGIAISELGVVHGVPGNSISGVPSQVSVDTSSQFAIRARNSSSLADRTFSLTVAVLNQPYFVTPAGVVGHYIDGDQIFDLQIETYNPDIYGDKIVTLVSGALPPGLTISTAGVISGVVLPAVLPGAIPPGFDGSITVIGSVPTVGVDPQTTLDTAFPSAVFNDGAIASDTGDLWLYTYSNWNNYGIFADVTINQPFDQAGFDFSTAVTDAPATYQFTLQVSNGQNNNQRTFEIVVYARSSMSADTTVITADNTYITADVYNLTTPVITTPTGSIGTVRTGNFFAFQFVGENIDGNPFTYTADTLPPGLTLDPNSGWLYGLIPALAVTTTYNFNLQVYDNDNPELISEPYSYSLVVEGDVLTDITWLTPGDLGTIVNGSTSTLYVKAVNSSGLTLQYQLAGQELGEAPVYNLLPQGLQLLPSGNIAGRVSFDTFALDSGATTFDQRTTSFDLVFEFTVNVTSTNGLVNQFKTFTIRLIREFDEPFDNLYIQAMPPLDDRAVLDSLLTDTDIFPPALIYRSDDPNFGVAQQVVYRHAYGLTAAAYDSYIYSLDINHYWKQLTLGQIETAQALDDSGNVIYEVVYSRVVDNLVNNAGESVGKSVTLPYIVDTALNGSTQTVYPNSLDNMRNQVIDTVGQVSNVLPRWMLSKQADGSILGFTPAWVIAYTVAGQSGQIAYNIETQFGVDQLNMIDFEVDRYELDNLLTKNWDRDLQQWTPHPPTVTTFDFAHDPPNTTWINSLSPQLTLPWTNNSGAAVEWSYATPPGTTFDQGSLQFIDPVDMYSNSNEYDQYLLFPRRKTIVPVGTYPLNFIPWYDQTNANAPVPWYDSVNDVPITWTVLEP